MDVVFRLMVYASIFLVPAILFGRYLFTPFDDCLRHAAKVVSGKSWAEILILREGVTLDQHPGWHAFLGALHAMTGLGKYELVIVEWALLFILVAIAVVPLFRRPEAWIAAMLIACLAFPESYVFRLTRGRPYLLSEAILLVLMLVWGRNERRTIGLLATTTALLALATWVHGTTWYLWGMVVIAFVLSGRRQDAVRFAACWVTGALSGAALTGHPFVYLFEQLYLLFLSFGSSPMARMLVGEFQPCSGGLLYLLALGFACLVRHAVTGVWMQEKAERFFVTLGIIGWLGGLHVSRLWTEWGLPASQLWLACMIQDILAAAGPRQYLARFWMTACLCAGFILSATGDLDGRWSRTLRPCRLGTCVNVRSSGIPQKQAEPDGWLPDSGGIVYNSQMDIFIRLFFENPTAPWRYVYGYESGLMSDENLRVLRNIQFNMGEWAAYKPWVDKMKRVDRLIVQSSVRPSIAELEWLEYRNGIWIGRAPGHPGSP